MNIDSNHLILLAFEQCAISAGSAHESGQSQKADEITSGMPLLLEKHKSEDSSWLDAYRNLMLNHGHPWVRYYAAMVVMRDQPIQVIPTLTELQEQDGMLSVMSGLLLQMLQSSKH